MNQKTFDSMLLQRVSENPSDIFTFKEIHKKLSGSQLSEEIIKSFSEAKGIQIFTEVIDIHLKPDNNKSFGELEGAALYEVLLCCKLVMNSSTGMDYFLTVPHSIESIVNSLNFYFKMLALQVLEILSVCCYYSNEAAISVFKAFQARGKTTGETPLAFLCAAFVDADVETKSAIMKFVNTMLAALQDSDDVFQDWLTYLQEENFEESYQDALKLLDDSDNEELAAYIASPSDNASNLKESNLSRFGDEKGDGDGADSHDRGINGGFGPLSSLQGRPASDNLNILDNRSRSADRLESPLPVNVNEETETKLKYANQPGALCIRLPTGMRCSQLFVCPDGGTMAGPLTISNSSTGWFSVLGPKTKVKWFYLDGNSLTTLHVSDNTNEGYDLAVANILQIRSKATDTHVANACPQSFEIETYNGSKKPFGCGDPEEQKHWLVAFQEAKARYSISISSYKEHMTESDRQSVEDVARFSDQFRRQGALYTSIVEEKRLLSIEDLGFNDQDVGEVSSYLDKLLLAAGFSGQLLQILQECVLLAPGDQFTWDAILAGIKRLRKQNRLRDSDDGDVTQSEDSFFDLDDATSPSSHSFSNQLNGKGTGESNSLFTEMSRLALMAMTKEQENKQLMERIQFLESTAREKEDHKIAKVVNSAVDRLKLKRLETKVRDLESKIRDLEEYSANDQSKIAKLDEEVREQKDNIEDLLFRNRKLQREIEAATTKVLRESPVPHQTSPDGGQNSGVDTSITAQKKVADSTGQPVPSSETDQTGQRVPDKFEKYRKMQKMLPEGAVRQKMQSDGFKEEDIEAFLAGRIVSSISSDVKGTDSSDKDSVVEIKGNDTVGEKSHLKEMLSKVPGAKKVNVLFNPSFLVTAAAMATKKPDQKESPPEGMPEKTVTVRPPQKLKPFYWEKIKPVEVVSTVFYKLPEFDIPDVFVSHLNELYVAKASVTKASEKAADQPLKPIASKLSSVVDPKRIQTVLIVMKKLKLEPEEVMKVVVGLDPAVLTAEATLSITSILPTEEEVSSVKAFSDESVLDRASRLVFHLSRVPHLVTRLHCHEIPFSWFGSCSSVFAQLRIVQAACDELHEFQGNMQNVLSIVLSLGNYLNVDTKFGCAYGFKLDTVLKLEAVKDGKAGSLLHLLASLVQDFAAEALTASEKWTAASAAARISIKEAIQDIDRLDGQVKKMRGELLKISDDDKNRGLDETYETVQGPVTLPFFTRLSNFLDEAEPKLSELRSEVKSTLEKVSELMKKYGETFDLEKKEDDSSVDGKEGEASKFKFFYVITTFFRKLRAAREDNLNRRKAAERASKSLEGTGKVAVKGKKVISGKKKEVGVGSTDTVAQKHSSEGPAPLPGSATAATTTTTTTTSSSSSTTGVGARAGSVSPPPRRGLLQRARSQRSITAGSQNNNIFSSFHSDHESTTEAVLTEVKRHSSKRGIAISILESLEGNET